jgi:hypothetical protein
MSTRFDPFFLVRPRKGPRRYAFYLRLSGRYFFAFTSFVTLFTLMSENNILFFMSSLLLSLLVIGSIFSDLGLYRIKVSRKEGEVFQGEESLDIWELKNSSPFPLFALQIGEFRESQYEAHFFLAYLGPFMKKQVRLGHKLLTKRGLHGWDSLYVMSSAPFGFSEKYFHLMEQGQRMIWPQRSQGPLSAASELSKWQKEIKPSRVSDRCFGPEVEGVGDYVWGSDAKHLSVLQSDFSRRQLKVRRFSDSDTQRTLTLELNKIRNAEELEGELGRLSAAVDRGPRIQMSLVIRLSSEQVRVYRTRKDILNALALTQLKLSEGAA